MKKKSQMIWIPNQNKNKNVIWLTVGNFQHHFGWTIQIYHATFEYFDECVGASSLSYQYTHILPTTDNYITYPFEWRRRNKTKKDTQILISA